MKKRIWDAKPDHPRIFWGVFVRGKVEGKAAHEPEFKFVTAAPLGAILSGGSQVAEKLGAPMRKVEVVAYHAQDEEFNLAERLAKTHARSLVESVTTAVDWAGEQWLRMTLGDAESIADEMRYLELCGQVKRHTSELGLIQLKAEL